MTQHTKKNQEGFTLLELVVVIGLIALTIGVTGDILLSLVRSYTTTQVETELEQNANFVLLKLEKELRNAESVDDIKPATITFTIKNSSNIDTSVTYAVSNGAVTRAEGSNTDTLTNTSSLNGVTVSCDECFARVGTFPPDIVKVSMQFYSKATNIDAPVNLENTIIVRKSY